MHSDKFYLIPFLSNELNLIGYPRLPYTIEKKQETEHLTWITSERNSLDITDAGTKVLESGHHTQVRFDSREMIESLVSVCFTLVNDVKALGNDEGNNSNELDRMRFENSNLKKQIGSLKNEIDQKMKIILSKSEKCNQLLEKLKKTEEKVKFLEKENLKIIHQSQSNEDIIIHKSRKIEQDLYKLQKILYKHSNIVDLKYLPDNFEMLNLQTNFKQAQNKIIYSSVCNKEEALKKTVSICQENAMSLLEENSTLKTAMLLLVRELNKLINVVSKRINVSFVKLKETEFNKMFIDKGVFSRSFKDSLKKYNKILTCVLQCFEECCFIIDDNCFVCLNEIGSKVKIMMEFV